MKRVKGVLASAWKQTEGLPCLGCSGHQRNLVEEGQRSLEGAEVPLREEEEQLVPPPHGHALI